MKKPFLTLALSILALTQILAQIPNTSSGLSASTANPGLPGFNSSFGPFFTNQLGNGFASTALNQTLIQLQFDLTRLYPVVVNINNSFDFTIAGTNAVGSAGVGAPNVSGTVVTGNGNPSASPGSSAASNLGTSLGQDLSGIIGGGANALGGGSTALNGGVSPAISPIATTGSTAAGSAAVSTGPEFTSTRDVLRALLLLQDDIEKMLPLVNALNGGNAATLGALFTNNPGVLTNSVIVNGTSTSTTTLTPTGR